MNSVVVETGEAVTKVGSSVDDLPSVVFPTERGTETERLRKALDVYDERIFRLDGTREENTRPPLLLSVDSFLSREERRKLVEVCFEELGVPAVFLGKGPALSAFSVEETTALVVDCGHSFTRIVPVWNGHVMGGQSRTEAGGRRMTEMAESILLEKRPDLAETTGKILDTRGKALWGYGEVVESFKESVMEIRSSGAQANRQSVGYTLPDGTDVLTGDERYGIGECLFEKEFAACLEKSVSGCPENIQRVLLSKVLVVGGVSLCSGIEGRVEEEGRGRGMGMRLIETSREDKKFSSWTGGSIL
ncbi:MAG: actin-like protein, partial [Amphiamblys sp. WSBS2006]